MIRSMTGFGRGEASDESRMITAEIRSVNHRYCEISTKMPRRFSFAEEPLKALIKERAKRGKIELSISLLQTDTALDAAENAVQLNMPLAKKYDACLQTLAGELPILFNCPSGDAAVRYLSLVATMPDVLKLAPAQEDEEVILKTLTAAVENALDHLTEMREVEGAKLASDILERNEAIRETVSALKKRAPLVKQAYAEKLRARIHELVGSVVKELPEERILTEAALFADKSDVTEELVRLDSHTKQLDAIIQSANGESTGKKLDFLVQEMNREANTICSKSNDFGITDYALTLKNEIEKIREQVQNIE